MVRNVVDRVRRYRAKINGDVLKARADELKEQMERAQAIWLRGTVKIEQEMKSMLQNISDRLNTIYYIVFAKEINKVMRKFSGGTLMIELEILQNKWIARGLNVNTLDSIKTYYIPSYVPVVIGYFLLDESLLDGEDVLA